MCRGKSRQRSAMGATASVQASRSSSRRPPTAADRLSVRFEMWDVGWEADEPVGGKSKVSFELLIPYGRAEWRRLTWAQRGGWIQTEGSIEAVWNNSIWKSKSKWKPAWKPRPEAAENKETDG